jgi:hypothetical protein
MPNSIITQSPGWSACDILSKRPSRVNYAADQSGLFLVLYRAKKGRYEVTYGACGSSGISGVVYFRVGTEGVLEILSPAFCTVVTAIGRSGRVACNPDSWYSCSCSCVGMSFGVALR